jgi:hypothetical protein
MKKTRESKSKIRYEPEADVLSWEFSKRNIFSAKESGNVVVHFTKDETPVLIEILEASKFLSTANALMPKDQKMVVRKTLALA